MRPRDLFGVSVRVIGLWEIVQATFSAFWSVLKLNTGEGVATVPEHNAFAIYYIVLGLLLVFLADPIVRIVYGPPSKVAPHDAAGNFSKDANPDDL